MKKIIILLAICFFSLNLESLIRNGFVKENSYFSKCVFASEGDLTKDGYIKCLVHNNNNKEATNEILKEQNYINQESPCTSFFKNIEQAVSLFNKSYDNKMQELELGCLTEYELLDFDNIPSNCLFTSVGDLTKDGYIKCLIHDKNSKNIDEKSYLQKINSTKAEKVCGLAFNTKVMILDTNGPQATFEKITSNWYLITDGTRVGWAFGGFIRK